MIEKVLERAPKGRGPVATATFTVANPQPRYQTRSNYFNQLSYPEGVGTPAKLATANVIDATGPALPRSEIGFFKKLAN